eukprot:CAMPEP_0206495220 /NCGR_PEP_ID=MMETSP0324_2-20121206/48321_1 /ASSEMBLY_ACC=CAM_ASM_000836 /TAXON_ID=2866 /ORGANISM="Crypthecodinium cohnii, Strain Seligo" /LENGTH=37 /DNA_ID= /DNA_START= /DNA_END= /DNA_ORIENTATION=
MKQSRTEVGDQTTESVHSSVGTDGLVRQDEEKLMHMS